MKIHYVSHSRYDKFACPLAPYWPSAGSLKNLGNSLLFCDAPPGSQVRTRQSRSELAKNLQKRWKNQVFQHAGPVGPRWAPGGFTWRPVDFAGGNAKTVGKTMVFCWRASVSRRPRPLQVRAGQSRSQLTKNLQNPLEKPTIPRMSYLLTSRKILQNHWGNKQKSRHGAPPNLSSLVCDS